MASKRKNANEQMQSWMDGISKMELSPRQKKVNYEQAWKDLRNQFIDQITVKDEGILYADDLKKAMDEIIYDYMD